jgi:acyl transferase domain-containing protein/acyl carrier protein
MGVDLLAVSPVFAARLAQCSAALEGFTGWRVEDVLADAVALERVDVVQPVLWAVMVSLAEVWRASGVEPAAVVGHSQGEIAAAVVAGALSLEEGARVVALRSRALLRLAGRGGMLSVAAGEREVESWLAEFGGQACVAVVNGPDAVTVSGEPGVLERLAAWCEGRGVRARVLPVDYASHSVQVEELEQELGGLLSGLSPVAGSVPFYSAVTGSVVSGAELDGGYWYRNLRGRVRFADAVGAVLADGRRVVVEVSAHPVLVGAMQDVAQERGVEDVVVSGTLRRGEGGADRLARSLAQVWVCGVPVAWERMFPGAQPARDLPTYAFQRRRYWLEAARRVGDVAAAGLESAEHPLLGAAVQVAGTDRLLLTGRISTASHAWLGDHRVLGKTVVPGTALVEFALRAGEQAGCEVLDELTLEVPLVLPERGAVQVQVSVDAPDPAGRRSLEVHARREDALPGAGWVLHARGTLSPTGATTGTATSTAATSSAASSGTGGEQWPPAGAVPAAPEELYTRLAGTGYGYGPSFRGLHRAWRRGQEAFAEVRLPEEHHDQAARYAIHPALLDAALHCAFLTGATDPATLKLPFSWTGIRLHAAGATALRVKATPTGPDTITLTTTDDTGRTLVAVERVSFQQVSVADMDVSQAEQDDSLFHVEWTAGPADPAIEPEHWAVVGEGRTELRSSLTSSGIYADAYPDFTALANAITGGKAVDVVLVAPASGAAGAETSESVAQAAALSLSYIQTWLADRAFDSLRLVFVTHGAVSVADEKIDKRSRFMAGASAWGVIRSAQLEYPGRFTLLDTDGRRPSWRAARVAICTGEAQMAVRQGETLVPRLVRVSAAPAVQRTSSRPSRAAGAALIVGGHERPVRSLARHLATERAARHVIMAGECEAGDDSGFTREMAELGVRVTGAARETADPDTLRQLFAAASAEQMVTEIVYAVSVPDDGAIASWPAEDFSRAVRRAMDTILYLDGLARDQEGPQFVLLSSAAGILGDGKRAGLAALSAVIDALGRDRARRGLATRSLAWGGQDEGAVDFAEESRATRGARQAALKRAFAVSESYDGVGGTTVLAGVEWNVPDLRKQAATSTLPPLFRRLFPARPRVPRSTAATTETGLKDWFTDLTEQELDSKLLDLVHANVATVLGYDSKDSVSADVAFRDLGIDSMTAVDLRNRINAATGLKLRSTMVFDHPSCAALAEHLKESLRSA